jgi:hypothetical protein
MTTSCNPADGIELLKNTWSTGVDPVQNPPEMWPHCSKVLNACMHHRHERIASRWRELGFRQNFPNVLTFEDKKHCIEN